MRSSYCACSARSRSSLCTTLALLTLRSWDTSAASWSTCSGARGQGKGGWGTKRARGWWEGGRAGLPAGLLPLASSTAAVSASAAAAGAHPAPPKVQTQAAAPINRPAPTNNNRPALAMGSAHVGIGGSNVHFQRLLGGTVLPIQLVHLRRGRGEVREGGCGAQVGWGQAGTWQARDMCSSRCPTGKQRSHCRSQTSTHPPARPPTTPTHPAAGTHLRLCIAVLLLALRQQLPHAVVLLLQAQQLVCQVTSLCAVGVPQALQRRLHDALRRRAEMGGSEGVGRRRRGGGQQEVVGDLIAALHVRLGSRQPRSAATALPANQHPPHPVHPPSPTSAKATYQPTNSQHLPTHLEVDVDHL
jgi:hypothetical protein